MPEIEPIQYPDHEKEGPPRDAPPEMPAPRLPRPPFWMVAIALVGIVFTWLPLAVIARARFARMSEPRILIPQDMGVQPKYSAQQTNFLFADHRAMRPGIDGTVPFGKIEDDDRYFKGFVRTSPDTRPTSVDFDKSLPQQVKITAQLLDRGQHRFNIYCYVCHGLDGSGNGPVTQRVGVLRGNNVLDLAWTQPATFTDDRLRKQTDGQIFNTITNGIRAMPSYGSQIPVEDRWAIVAYVRALQYSQQAPSSVVPQGQTVQDK